MGVATRSGPFPFRILLVDDDPALAGLYADLLSAHGYEVHIARGGFEALADLRRSLPDVVISDLTMPGMSGLELLAVLRQRFPMLPLVALSGGEELESDALVADIALCRSAHDDQQIFESIAHVVRAGVRQRAVRPAALPFVTRQGDGACYVACGECLRSFRLPTGSAENCRPGAHSCVCVYCGTPQNYIIGEAGEAA
ncbi:MAG: response regulator transcription factor [Terriglobales bacterium]